MNNGRYNGIEVERPRVSSAFRVVGTSVDLPNGVVCDVQRVASAMNRDASIIREVTETIESRDVTIARQLSASLLPEYQRSARSDTDPVVSVPVDDLEIVYRGAQAILQGYEDRKRRHLEDKAIPQQPSTLGQRCRKLGAEILGSLFVAVGINSRSGRSARRIQEVIDEAELDEWLRKSDQNKKKKKRAPHSIALDPWAAQQQRKDLSDGDEDKVLKVW